MGKDSTSVVVMLQSLQELEQLLDFIVQLALHLLELNSSSLICLHKYSEVSGRDNGFIQLTLTQQKLQN